MDNTLNTEKNSKINTASDHQLDLTPVDNERQAELCGPMDDHLKTIERRLGVEISYRGNQFKILGKDKICQAVILLLKNLYIETAPVKGVNTLITSQMVHLAILEANVLEQDGDDSPAQTKEATELGADYEKMLTIKTKRGVVKPRNGNQQSYVQNIVTHDISFGVGVAGTGKTYLAVACAVEALERQEVRRILLTRPAVEAGEKLGFLPGDLSQKIDPY